MPLTLDNEKYIIYLFHSTNPQTIKNILNLSVIKIILMFMFLYTAYGIKAELTTLRHSLVGRNKKTQVQLGAAPPSPSLSLLPSAGTASNTFKAVVF